MSFHWEEIPRREVPAVWEQQHQWGDSWEPPPRRMWRCVLPVEQDGTRQEMWIFRQRSRGYQGVYRHMPGKMPGWWWVRDLHGHPWRGKCSTLWAAQEKVQAICLEEQVHRQALNKFRDRLIDTWKAQTGAGSP